jgi:hypothetical protein
MSCDRDEAFAKIGKRVQLHDYEEDKPADVYEYVIEWDALDRRIDMFDASDYERFLTELA